MAENGFRSDLDIVSKFYHRTDSAILSLVTDNDGMAWIGSADNLLMRVDQTGNVNMSVTLTQPPLFSTILGNGDIVISHGLSQHTKLTRVTVEGVISDFTDLAPCEAIYDVKVTSNNEVLVCKENSFFDNIGKLVKLSCDGAVIWEIGRDVLKCCPTRVTEMRDGTYCVKIKDRLAFLTDSGKLLKQTEPSNELSNVCTIVSDEKGHVIGGTVIADTDRQFVYIFSEIGQCVKKFALMDSARLYVLTIDKDKNFWIGTDTGQIVIARYLH